MSDAAVIPAAYVKLSTMVDGTIRVVIDVEPTNRDAAFRLFDKPGAALAIARLEDGAAVEHDRKAQAQPPAEPLERKPLSLASKVAITCGQPSFHAFLQADRAPGWLEAYGMLATAYPKATATDEQIATGLVRLICQVDSRREIVENSPAARRWADLEADYHHWQRTGEAA